MAFKQVISSSDIVFKLSSFSVTKVFCHVCQDDTSVEKAKWCQSEGSVNHAVCDECYENPLLYKCGLCQSNLCVGLKEIVAKKTFDGVTFLLCLFSEHSKIAWIPYGLLAELCQTGKMSLEEMRVLSPLAKREMIQVPLGVSEEGRDIVNQLLAQSFQPSPSVTFSESKIDSIGAEESVTTQESAEWIPSTVAQSQVSTQLEPDSPIPPTASSETVLNTPERLSPTRLSFGESSEPIQNYGVMYRRRYFGRSHTP